MRRKSKDVDLHDFVPVDPAVFAHLRGLYRCLTCSEEREIYEADFALLTHAPHCWGCGGAMEKVDSIAPKPRSTPSIRCPYCRIPLVSAEAMSLHFRCVKECFAFAIDSDDTVALAPKRLALTKTVRIARAFGKWQVVGMCPNGVTDYFAAFPKRADAVAFLIRRLPSSLHSFLRPKTKK